MITNLEKSELEVLERLGLPSLPPADGGSEWATAVVLVHKEDNTSNYAIARRLGGSVAIVKDFGTSSRIRNVDEIRPLGPRPAPKSPGAEINAETKTTKKRKK